MKPTKYVRLSSTIIDTKTQKRTNHKFINAAKRASRKLQMELDGALGRGSVRAP